MLTRLRHAFGRLMVRIHLALRARFQAAKLVYVQHKRPLIPGAGARPAAGYDWNPLLQYPRNAPCWCGSLKKAKKCHLPVQPRVLPTAQVELLNDFLAQAKLAPAYMAAAGQETKLAGIETAEARMFGAGSVMAVDQADEMFAQQKRLVIARD